MSGSARPLAGYHALMLAVNAFMPPAVNVFMQAVSTRSCVGKRCIVSTLIRRVNMNQDNRRFLRLSSVGSLPLAKNALHCTGNLPSLYLVLQIFGCADAGIELGLYRYDASLLTSTLCYTRSHTPRIVHTTVMTRVRAGEVGGATLYSVVHC